MRQSGLVGEGQGSSFGKGKVGMGLLLSARVVQVE